jgi:hypothetical protein
MKITKRQLLRIIREEAESADLPKHPADVEAVEDAWAGGEDLVEPLDYSKILTGEANIDDQEVLDIVVNEVRRRMNEKKSEAEATVKYNADPALKGDQTKLPDQLQKGIIDAADDDDDYNEDRARQSDANYDDEEDVNESLVGRLRKIVREVTSLKEGNMKERFGEIQDAVLFILDSQPGIRGEKLAADVMEELSDYGMIDPSLAITKEEVFDILDVMIDESEVFFDDAEDAWYISNSPEATAAMSASSVSKYSSRTDGLPRERR